MEIILEKAIENDAAVLFQMQIDSFKPILNKYKDYNTSPANESIEKTILRINNPSNNYYKIILDSNLVGAICISKEIPNKFWISPMFIHPNYQGKGIAQRIFILIEEMFPKAQSFELATILEEERNCFLYEKMGYKRTEVIKKLNNKTTLIYYKKER
ncbi:MULTISPECIES: GNAT family N-acetyltransferase [Bacillus]|uniref:N-acetyltransferase n=2 Tax=Bacillus cereus group TaxID=86661 RepID=A0A2A7D9U4_BACAN|nr:MULTISPECIES: GNAT family N-acetyltransferase [Bacillus]MCP1163870.1 GNAT family N-acetyltransferase [Bacillus sp. 1813sda1]MDC7975218.1 GNAT family N-acetyltransferase [Bacillus sp. BLCC-B18]OTW71597.1 GNAT family N-acetyltransferase [Bacillus thuringiensis serovar coreanensis]OTX55217.1 GNAT family N-acetyltransferase [Bacillus thuringiensis serovar sooncheon]OTX58554.1 GNAT family N-acetyltransferase [Bacillus thuringiensis serovar guiyangiensis]